MPKKGAVAKGGEDARAEQKAERRRERADGVASDEHAQQDEQCALAVHVTQRERNQRRPERDAERVGRDEDAGLRDADVKVLRELREQAYDDELGGANAEGGYSQR